MQRDIDDFHEALARPADERTAFVEQQHHEEPERARRLLRLLEAHARAERAEGDDEPDLPSTMPALLHRVQPPEQIGAYRVLERLGEGGIGVVYAAEQHEPLRRRVAIKVVKLGMDTHEVLARFEAERQALAMMDHPGVAKALDAGITAEGRPYFVMELVKGVPLTTYAHSQALPLRARLELFVEICAAVQHAHQKGIIHRDLKPSNILVTTFDGRPVPKIIDFGVAKATASRLTERTVFTEQGRLIGTPEYMSPEQAEMSGLDVDTRTDVYSLGVVLYELLTGELPFEGRGEGPAGYSELLRKIREVPPKRPSMRIADGRSGSTVVSVRAATVRRELDWIVLQALEKDRTRRYGSASALGDDVERYLRDLPVHARPPSTVYVLRKFVQRHRLATGLMLLVVVTTLIGITGLTLGLVRARSAERLATERADHAQAMAGFLEQVLFGADPEEGGGQPTLAQAIDRAGMQVDAELGEHPEVEASVRESLGVAYRRRSLFERARPHLERSLLLREQVLGEAHMDTARSRTALGALRFEHDGDFDGAAALFAQVGAALQQNGLAGTVHEAWLLLDVGLVALASDRLADAERALRTCRDLLATDRGDTHADVSRPLRGLARCALARDDVDAAERLARRAVSLCAGTRDEYLGARAQLALVDVLRRRGQVDEAADVLATAEMRLTRMVGAQHIRKAECTIRSAHLLLQRGDFAAAERSARRCLELRRTLLAADHPDILASRLLLAEIQLAERAAGPGSGTPTLTELDDDLRDLADRCSRRLAPDHPLALRIAEARIASAGDDAGRRALRTARHAELVESRARRLSR
jgi:serine/threonine protein kinase/tetratricopeptide (TPR) repeat protein